MHWTWLLTLKVKSGDQVPYPYWIYWHYKVLLPAPQERPQ